MCERVLQLGRSSSHALSAHRGGRRFYGEVDVLQRLVFYFARLVKLLVVELHFMFFDEDGAMMCEMEPADYHMQYYFN